MTACVWCKITDSIEKLIGKHGMLWHPSCYDDYRDWKTNQEGEGDEYIGTHDPGN